MRTYGPAPRLAAVEVQPVALAGLGKDDGSNGGGSFVVITLLLSALGGAVGYAIGYERCSSKGSRRNSSRAYS